mmetsp:Transcript_24911/g.64897  ORF Transcript_24911/g.64897 Transcript_24911/m.64897 type:complete len:255 (-) Transcript_24911:1016-1780(-)
MLFFSPVQRILRSTLHPRSRSAALASSAQSLCFSSAMLSTASAPCPRTSSTNSRLRTTQLRSAMHAWRCSLIASGCMCITVTRMWGPLHAATALALAGVFSISAASALAPCSATFSLRSCCCIVSMMSAMPPRSPMIRFTSSLPATARSKVQPAWATVSFFWKASRAGRTKSRHPRSTMCRQYSSRDASCDSVLNSSAAAVGSGSLPLWHSRITCSNLSRPLYSEQMALTCSFARPNGTRGSSSLVRARRHIID